MNRFENKVIVITGGSSGIGRGIAKYFSDEGANVVIFGRNQERLDTTCAELNNAR